MMGSARLAAAAALVVVVAGFVSAGGHASTPLTTIDLSKYVRVGRFDLPEPTRTVAPPGSLLAQEASAVTYDWDTGTLFVAGDGGTSIVQVSKTGQLIDSMTLAAGSSPQGTTFYDTEGLTYIGGGQFVMTEERDRQIDRFTYHAGTTLTRPDTQTVKLGTTIGNIGLEGVTNDPVSGGFVLVKEKTPESIFQTNVDWAAGTATNGSPTTVESNDLFDPTLAGLNDFSDVYALGNLSTSTLTGAERNNLLIISQESGKIENLDRSGHVSSSLTIQTDPGNPLSVPDQTMEGVTMDDDGTLYVVNENGGGDSNHPQLWVYKHTDAPNQAPTGVLLSNVVSTLPENTSTLGGLKVADITVLDDGLGVNNLTVSGPDAASFEINGGSLFVKAGTVLDFETKPVYHVNVDVDDPSVGASPDASVSYTLTLTDVVNENAPPGTVAITEVAPWSSGNSPLGADWFEVTNLGSTAVDITGWKMDDDSRSFGSAVALRNVTSIGAGRSAIFIETSGSQTDAGNTTKFSQLWFGSPTPPAGVQIGNYGGSGVGLSTGGDDVNLFNTSGGRVTGVHFGTSPGGPFPTFDNSAGIGGTGSPPPTISTLSAVGVHGAFAAPGDAAETGSPGADFLPPTFTDVPADITAEATGTTTPVSFTPPTATDLVDGSRPVSCLPAGPFPIGTTTVTCSASDTSGNGASVSFNVTVRDTKPPTVNVPGDILAEATGTTTPVPFGPVTATDTVDGPMAATCTPASPGPFPVGETHVDCFAIDSHGNRGAASFDITVRDTTAPALTVPDDMVVDATSPAGAVVSYDARATDAVGVTAFSCDPASGSTFAIGTTTVTCSASDDAGNAATASFTVHVKGAAEQLDDLRAAVAGVGPGASLTAKLGNGTCNQLRAFMNEVNAQAGKHLTTDQASSLIARAQRIAAVLAC
jgi:uncharacterized protein YjiK